MYSINIKNMAVTCTLFKDVVICPPKRKGLFRNNECGFLVVYYSPQDRKKIFILVLAFKNIYIEMRSFVCRTYFLFFLNVKKWFLLKIHKMDTSDGLNQKNSFN